MTFKRIQINGKRYRLPEEEAKLEKLIQKAIALTQRYQETKQALDEVKAQIAEIARQRRPQGKATVVLEALSGKASVTFREDLKVKPEVESLKSKLKGLFERFFELKKEYKATKDLKNLILTGTDYGLDEKIEKEIREVVEIKEIKPYVKVEAR